MAKIKMSKVELDSMNDKSTGFGLHLPIGEVIHITGKGADCVPSWATKEKFGYLLSTGQKITIQQLGALVIDGADITKNVGTPLECVQAHGHKMNEYLTKAFADAKEKDFDMPSFKVTRIMPKATEKTYVATGRERYKVAGLLPSDKEFSEYFNENEFLPIVQTTATGKAFVKTCFCVEIV